MVQSFRHPRPTSPRQEPLRHSTPFRLPRPHLPRPPQLQDRSRPALALLRHPPSHRHATQTTVTLALPPTLSVLTNSFVPACPSCPNSVQPAAHSAGLLQY